jgi:hypothetical protein
MKTMKNRCLPFLGILFLLFVTIGIPTRAAAISGAVATANATLTAQPESGPQVAADTAAADSTNRVPAESDAAKKPFDWKGLIIGLLFLGF